MHRDAHGFCVLPSLKPERCPGALLPESRGVAHPEEVKVGEKATGCPPGEGGREHPPPHPPKHCWRVRRKRKPQGLGGSEGRASEGVTGRAGRPYSFLCNDHPKASWAAWETREKRPHTRASWACRYLVLPGLSPPHGFQPSGSSAHSLPLTEGFLVGHRPRFRPALWLGGVTLSSLMFLTPFLGPY